MEGKRENEIKAVIWAYNPDSISRSHSTRYSSVYFDQNLSGYFDLKVINGTLKTMIF